MLLLHKNLQKDAREHADPVRHTIILKRTAYNNMLPHCKITQRAMFTTRPERYA